MNNNSFLLAILSFFLIILVAGDPVVYISHTKLKIYIYFIKIVRNLPTHLQKGSYMDRNFIIF
jgi:hypothetical protein